MGALKRLALVLLPVALLLALTELALVALDVGAPDARQHVSRGFAAEGAYLVAGGDGAWRTQLFDDPARELEIPARDERRRVLLFGGSNTQAFPDAVLEDLLNGVEGGWARAGDALQPLPRTRGPWEVVNLGREGYGSARVAILAEQACAALRPDLVVIYSGNNEFVEVGFREELAAGGVQPGGLAAALEGLRSFRVLRGAFERVPAARPPPALVRDPAQRPVSAEQHAAIWKAYRENLGRMCAAAEAAGARVVLCTVAGNLLSPPYVAPAPEERGVELAERVQGMRNRALAWIPLELRDGLRPLRRLRMSSWSRRLRGGEPPREQPPRPTVPRVLGAPLDDTSATSGLNAASAEGAHWPDPAGWGSDVDAHLGTIAKLMHAEVDDALRAELERARAPLRSALELAPDDPRVLYDLGLLTWLLGPRDQAVRWLRQAQLGDRAPHCATVRSNEIVREVAEQRGARLLDVVAGFERACPDGLLGYEVLMDVCHLQPGARVVLMRRLAGLLPRLLDEAAAAPGR